MYKCIKFTFMLEELPPACFLGGVEEGVDHVFFVSEIAGSELTAIGISNSDDVSGCEVFDSRNALALYLESIWADRFPDQNDVEYSPQEKATSIWGVKEAL